MAASLLQQLDGSLDQLFSGWNVYTTGIVFALIAYLFSPLFLTSEPDTHPLLLARQAAPSAVRQSGESAVYRSLEAPHGYPLRTGLDVKDAGTPKWSAGRDGDLRDIWNEASCTRELPPAEPSRILSIKGRNKPAIHELTSLSKEINIIGKHVLAQGGTRIAIYLPNSVELVTTLFAAAFYGFVPILIAQSLPLEMLSSILQETRADVIVVSAGILSPEDLAHASSKLKHIIWVVEETSRHMDWKEGPRIGNNVSEWHGLVDQYSASIATELPSTTFDSGPPGIVSVVGKGPNAYEAVEFTQKNIVAAVAAQISALPRAHRLSQSDVVISLESLAYTYPLTVSLAALYSHATLALTTVAGSSPDFDLAFQSVKPTVVITTSETLSEAHARKHAAAQGLFQKLHRYRHASKLAAGTMGKVNSVTKAVGPRIIYTSAIAGADSTPLTASELTDLRILTGARIVYALTAPRVAGAVSQTNALDYRIDQQSRRSHFGAPLSAVEVKLISGQGAVIPDEGDSEIIGEIVVSGPAVVGGEVNMRLLGKFGNDSALNLV